MPIYTKGGDSGKTSLFDGTRVSKDSVRVDSYGAVDELNSVLGVSRIYCNSRLKDLVVQIHRDLFKVGGELADPQGGIDTNPRVTISRIRELEHEIDQLMGDLKPIKRFILPGGSKAAAFFHLARTVCRRAERKVVTLSDSEYVREEVMSYLNRLSDLLYAMARFANHVDGREDTEWYANG